MGCMNSRPRPNKTYEKMSNDYTGLNPQTPEKQRASSVFLSPSNATGPLTPIGTPGKSKFGPNGRSASLAPGRSPSPSPGRAASEDIKPTISELNWNARAGSVASSVSPSESASNVGGGSRASSVGRASSVLSRSSTRAPFYNRARSISRAPSRSPAPISRAASNFPAPEPLFSSADDDDDDDGVTCLSPDMDDDDDTGTILGPQSGGKVLRRDSTGSSSVRSTKGSTISSSASTDMPKFKPHPHGLESVELQMINNELLSCLFSNPSNRESLKEVCEEYGFRSPFELKKLMTETIKRAADSNDGKFMLTSIEDPRKSYPKVINTADNPFSLD